MKIAKILRVLYCFLCVCILILTYVLFSHAPTQYNHEVFEASNLFLFCINFPASLFVEAIHHILFHK